MKQSALYLGTWTLILTVFYVPNSYGYIGPGLGLGTIAIALGFFIGLVFLVIGLIWYPLKRLIKKIKQK